MLPEKGGEIMVAKALKEQAKRERTNPLSPFYDIEKWFEETREHIYAVSPVKPRIIWKKILITLDVVIQTYPPPRICSSFH